MKTPRSRPKRPKTSTEGGDRKSDTSEAFHLRQLQAARSQLAMYARDLKILLAKEELKSQRLKLLNQQLQTYARDIKIAYDAERERSQELEQAYAESLLRLSLASRYKDEETGGHIERLSHYAKTLALKIGWDSSRAQRLFVAAPMHDVGKIGIPDAVLGKHGPLDEQEWELIKRHPDLGASLLTGTSSPLANHGT